MIGTRIGHYEIRARLGSGGMGEVYRARDEVLGRDVALKLLLPNVQADSQRLARLRREAATMARLNDPHIVQVYSFEESDGRAFLTMELVRGHSLADLVRRSPLPATDVIRLAAGICRALETAHANGIVHRDLKPSNVMIDESGHVKVVDFGLARLVAETRDSTEHTAPLTLTATEHTPGTLPYMSPEQLRGEGADASTDVYALGVLMYEALAGTRPFTGPTSATLSASILSGDARRIEEAAPETPALLGELIHSCMAVDRAKRCPSAADVADELRRLLGSTSTEVGPDAPTLLKSSPARSPRSLPGDEPMPKRNKVVLGSAAFLLLAAVAFWAFSARDDTPSPSHTEDRRAHSVAILPFRDLSPETGGRYLAEGLPEEIIHRLSQTPRIRVISRTSAFSVREVASTVEQIADLLDVAYVLEGSVRRHTDRIRVNAQLIDIDAGRMLWSDTFDQDVDDPFTLQDLIAQRVAKSIHDIVTLPRPPFQRPSSESYLLYLRGRAAARVGTPEFVDRSDSLLTLATRIDESFAPAWAALSANAIHMVGIGERPYAEGMQFARETAMRAIELDERCVDAWVQLGYLDFFDSDDLEFAATNLQRALEIDPRHEEALRRSATLLQGLGRPEEALAVMQHLANRDPLDAAILHNLGRSYYFVRNWDSAIAAYDRTLRISPGQIGTAGFRALCMILDGRPDGALAWAEREPVAAVRLLSQALAHHALGDTSAARSAMATLEAEHAEGWAYNIASVHAHLGDRDACFEWLATAIVNQDPGLAEIASDPLFDHVRADERWIPFVTSIGKAPDQIRGVGFSVSLAELE